jgi:hypothetical protein
MPEQGERPGSVIWQPDQVLSPTDIVATKLVRVVHDEFDESPMRPRKALQLVPPHRIHAALRF